MKTESMEYLGYVAIVEVDCENNLLYGRVYGARDVISFEGKNVAELKREFKKSIDDYLKFCEDEGLQPDKSYSGNFTIRREPDLHRALHLLAVRKGKKLEPYVKSVLKRHVEELDEVLDI